MFKKLSLLFIICYVLFVQVEFTMIYTSEA